MVWRHDFEVLIEGVDEMMEGAIDALRASGCGDAKFGYREGMLFGQFSRNAITFHEAATSAIDDIKRAKIGRPVINLDGCRFAAPMLRYVGA